MNIDAFLQKLKQVKNFGNRTWTASCPAHDDQKPSLSVTLGDDGHILVHCHAGCTVKQVCLALHVNVSDLFTGQDRSAKKQWGRIVATYDYRDADGTLIYQIRRDEYKNFSVRRPTPNRGWINGLGDTKRVLYRLPELIAAHPDEFVFIAEGEKDDDRLWNEGLVAATNPFGAGKWSKLSDDSVLDDRDLVIVPDNDGPGRRHAFDVAQRRSGRSRTIRILELPDDVHDISEWFDAGGTADQLRELAKSSFVFDGTPPEHWTDVSACESETDEADESESDPPTQKSASQATILLQICDCVEFFHDGDTAFASLVDNRRRLTWTVRSRQFKAWLGRQFYVQHGKAVGSQALSDALNAMEGRALFDGPQITTHVRLAQHSGCIYVDLADDEYRVVEITPAGWSNCANPPVRFRRPGAMRPLPMPEPGGSLEDLRSLLNIQDKRSFILVCAWLVAAYRPDFPIPILTFSSEQGSGKTTAAEFLRGLVDPNMAPIRAEPTNSRDLMVTARHSHVVTIDNSSGVAGWLSDALCRLSTGGGFATRALFENDEEFVFESLRPVILTGIEELGARSDLLDRMIRISLPHIEDGQRRPERELLEAFERLRPKLLGAIFSAVSAALRNIDSINLSTLPRMADFAEWSVAAESALPLATGEFMQAYCENRASAHELAIEASVIGEPLRQFAQEHGAWTGKSSQLLELLNASQPEGALLPRGWPKTSHHLSGQLRRLAPNLRELGVHFQFLPRTRNGRLLSVLHEPQTSVKSVTERHADVSDASRQPQRDADDTDDAGDAESRDPTGVVLTDDPQERAAILEYEGGLSRDEADLLARSEATNPNGGNDSGTVR